MFWTKPMAKIMKMKIKSWLNHIETHLWSIESSIPINSLDMVSKLIFVKGTVGAARHRMAIQLSTLRGSVINDNAQIIIWTSSEFQWRLASLSLIDINDDIRHCHRHLSSSLFFPSFSPWKWRKMTEIWQNCHF